MPRLGHEFSQLRVLGRQQVVEVEAQESGLASDFGYVRFHM